MKALVSILVLTALGGLLTSAGSATPATRHASAPTGIIAFAGGRDGNPEIYLMTSTGRIVRRLTNDPKFDAAPVWSPDGRRIAFYSQRTPNGDVFVVNADGTGLKNLTRNPAHDGPGSWSSDGKSIVFDSDRASGAGIYVMRCERLRRSSPDDRRNGQRPRLVARRHHDRLHEQPRRQRRDLRHEAGREWADQHHEQSGS